MAKPSKKVVCLRQNDELFKLFSVSEARDGSLIVSLEKEDRNLGVRHGFNGQIYDNSNTALDEQRFTVHPSVGFDGLSITQNSRNGNIKVTSKLLVDATKDDLVACFVTKFCPIMSERSKANLSRKDCEFFEIAKICYSDFSSLIYHLVVTGRDIKLSSTEGFSLYNLIFNHFSLNVYTTFVNFSGGLISNTLHFSTFPMQINRNAVAGSSAKKSPNLSDDQIPYILLQQSEFAAAAVVLEMKEDPDFPVDLSSLPLFFYPSVEALQIGRMLRGGI